MNDNDKVVMVPFFVAESMADRLSKANKRLWIICILLIILLVGTNAMWIWYESQFVYYEEHIEQEVETGEGDATRFADANNTRDIIDSQTRGTQAILDKLCTLELDGYKRENDNLRTQLNMTTSNVKPRKVANFQWSKFSIWIPLHMRKRICLSLMR